MKKILLSLLIIISSFTYSHTLLLSIENDKENKGVIILKGDTDNGESVEGEEIFLLSDLAYDGDEEVLSREGADDYNGKLVLYKGEFDETGIIKLPKPSVKRYIALIYGGIGHLASVKGIPLSKDELENWKNILPEYVEKLNLDKEKFEKNRF